MWAEHHCDQFAEIRKVGLTLGSDRYAAIEDIDADIRVFACGHHIFHGGHIAWADFFPHWDH